MSDAYAPEPAHPADEPEPSGTAVPDPDAGDADAAAAPWPAPSPDISWWQGGAGAEPPPAPRGPADGAEPPQPGRAGTPGRSGRRPSPSRPVERAVTARGTAASAPTATAPAPDPDQPYDQALDEPVAGANARDVAGRAPARGGDHNGAAGRHGARGGDHDGGVGAAAIPWWDETDHLDLDPPASTAGLPDRGAAGDPHGDEAGVTHGDGAGVTHGDEAGVPHGDEAPYDYADDVWAPPAAADPPPGSDRTAPASDRTAPELWPAEPEPEPSALDSGSADPDPEPSALDSGSAEVPAAGPGAVPEFGLPAPRAAEPDPPALVADLPDLPAPPAPAAPLAAPIGRHRERPRAVGEVMTGLGRRVDPYRPASVRRRLRKKPRHPFAGMVALVVLAFAAAFFSWVSATPLWLALGHGRSGVATVATCPESGVHERCADFTATDNSYTTRVRLAGPDSVDAADGEHLAALMVSRSSTVAYAGDRNSLYLGWVPGVVLVLLCGPAIMWATGALRLPGRRARTVAVLGSLFGPLLLLGGMLAATW